MAHIEPQKGMTVSILTPEDIQKFMANHQWEQTLRNQQMNLHLRPISEFIHFSIEEKRQAFIEWKLSQSLFPDLDTNQEALLWDFNPEHTPQDRMAVVKRYEAVIDRWRDWPSLEQREMKALIAERIHALQEAMLAKSTLSLNDILNKPGFERFKLTDPQAKTLERNKQTFQLYGLEVTYPNALLYELFNHPPAFLQRKEKVEMSEALNTDLQLKPREQAFVNWLKDSAKSHPKGWLTIERVNELNKSPIAREKVFKPKKNSHVVANTVKPLIKNLRQSSEFKDRIESRPRQGNAWRLTDWEKYRD